MKLVLTMQTLTQVVDALRELVGRDEYKAFHRFLETEVEPLSNTQRQEHLDRLLAISEYSTRLVRRLRSYEAE